MITQAVIALNFVVLSLLPTNVAGDCSCTEVEQLYDFTTVPITDMPWRNDYPWKFISCDGDQVTIELVFEDNPLLDTFWIGADGNQPIYYQGTWTPFKYFVNLVEPMCHRLTS